NAELPIEPRFLMQQHSQVKRDRKNNQVYRYRSRSIENRPSSDHRQHREIHRVPHVTIKSDDNQMLRRIPRSTRPFSRNKEVPDAPQKEKATHSKQNDSGDNR